MSDDIKKYISFQDFEIDKVIDYANYISEEYKLLTVVYKPGHPGAVLIGIFERIEEPQTN